MEQNHPGAVIKRFRKEKGLTQSELCGEEISRNLLSQIESGKVRPSLHTMTYLAERLGIPTSLLFLSEEDEQTLRQRALDVQIEQAYDSGSLEDVITLTDPLTAPHRINRHFRTEAIYRLGFTAYRSGELIKAWGFFKQLLREEHTSDAAKKAASVLMERMKQMLASDPLRELYYGDPLHEGEGEWLIGFAAACAGQPCALGVAQGIAHQAFADHTAKQLALSMLYESAGSDSECRAAQMKIKDKELEPAAALYYYRCVEECCVRMSDYESAYKMAKRRARLFEDLKHQMERIEKREG